jgi:hypothetical protein
MDALNALLGQPAAPVKGKPQDLPLPAPPPGTYDPAIDYNAGASQRGYDNLFGDAQTAYEQGQEDYGLGRTGLIQGRDWDIADIGTNRTRLNEDYGRQTQDLGRNYGILGRQQGERAAQQGITSAGLLGKSAGVRGANQQRDQSGLDLAHTRGLGDLGTAETRTNTLFDQGLQKLDLANVRQFGAFNGNGLLNPLTGKPEVGSLVTRLTRAGGENNAFQTASAGQRTQGAQQGGYIHPSLLAPAMPSRQATLDYLKKRKGT